MPRLGPDPPAQEATLNSTRRDFLTNAGSVAAALAFAVPRAHARSGRAVSFFDWREVRPGVFATDLDSTGGNCMIVRGEDGSLLVDTKFPLFAGQLARDAADLTGRPLSRVVNTHHHGDHTGGNVLFAGEVPMIAHDSAAPRVEQQFQQSIAGVTRAAQGLTQIPEPNRDAVAADVQQLTDRLGSFTPDSWKPDTTVVAGRTGIDLGGLWLELIHFGQPAHTDNDLVVHLPERNVVHTGDLVFNGLHPFFDPSCADARGWIDTLGGILDLCDDETIVVPGHGPITDADGVRVQLRYIERLWDAVEAEIDAGKTVEQVQQMSWPFMDGLGFERIRPRSIAFVYAEIEASKQ